MRKNNRRVAGKCIRRLSVLGDLQILNILRVKTEAEGSVLFLFI